MVAYLDGFTVLKSPMERFLMQKNCATARENLGSLMKLLGLKLQVQKGEWIGLTVVEHLGI